MSKSTKPSPSYPSILSKVSLISGLTVIALRVLLFLSLIIGSIIHGPRYNNHFAGLLTDLSNLLEFPLIIFCTIITLFLIIYYLCRHDRAGAKDDLILSIAGLLLAII